MGNYPPPPPELSHGKNPTSHKKTRHTDLKRWVFSQLRPVVTGDVAHRITLPDKLFMMVKQKGHHPGIWVPRSHVNWNRVKLVVIGWHVCNGWSSEYQWWQFIVPNYSKDWSINFLTITKDSLIIFWQFLFQIFAQCERFHLPITFCIAQNFHSSALIMIFKKMISVLDNYTNPIFGNHTYLGHRSPLRSFWTIIVTLLTAISYAKNFTLTDGQWWL